ncbi:MAG: hypothetical protein HYY16_00525 [Planctomycetes bacterium]|nr:hypothetical protein [Planctomycetota bacterium]
MGERLICVLWGVLLLAGCTDAPAAQWFETAPFGQPREKIMAAMTQVAERKGFVVETSDAAEGVLTTQWRVMLRPQWRQGRRERLEMVLEEDRPRGHFVRVRIVREINDNGRVPLSLAEANWIDGGGDDDLAHEMTYLLKLKIEGVRLDD